MTIITKYRIYCTTESAWTEGWMESAPTLCFTDTGHTVNSNSVQVLEVIDTAASKVVIEEENVPLNEIATNGKFKCKGFTFDIAPLTTDSLTVSWPFPISVMESFFTAKAEMNGDILNCTVGENTIVGTLTSNVANGDTTFDVALTVVQNAKIGYNLRLNGTLIGIIIAIDLNAQTITVDTGTTTTYTSGQTVGIETNTIENFHICGIDKRISIGSSKVGGMYLKANTNVKVQYENKHATDTKTFCFEVEYIY